MSAQSDSAQSDGNEKERQINELVQSRDLMTDHGRVGMHLRNLLMSQHCPGLSRQQTFEVKKKRDEARPTSHRADMLGLLAADQEDDIALGRVDICIFQQEHAVYTVFL